MNRTKNGTLPLIQVLANALASEKIGVAAT
jgi:hypothetical protein